MSEPPLYPDPRSDVHTVPRWVKVFGFITIAVILLLAILLLTRGSGGHGPGRHLPSGDAGGQRPLSSVTNASTSSAGEIGPGADEV